MSMKIAFVNARYAPNEFGGAERTVRTIAETHVAHGHEACAISVAHDKSQREGELNGVRTRYVPLTHVYEPWKERPGLLKRALFQAVDSYHPLMGARVGRILDEEKPDLVQCGNLRDFSVAVWVEAKKRGLPVVQMLHDYYLGCVNSSMFRGGKNCETQCAHCRVLCAPRRALSNTPRAVISLSGRTLEKLEGCGLFEEVPHKQVIFGISNQSVDDEARAPREKEGLVVGYLGRIERTKGVETLLEATSLIRHPKLRVLLGGTGERDYMVELRGRYSSPAIAFLGYVKPEEFFARIDVLVVPSLWEEPLGRVIYEAYARGVAVIANRLGGMPEIIEEGRTGYVVTPGDVKELAAVIEQMLTTQRRSDFRSACLAKAKEFSAERRYPEYHSAWQRAFSET
jgi:glycosyltransferase involved in cell wall biosynthesis